MDYKDKLRRIPLGVAAGLATLVLASGGSVAWFTWRSLNPVPPIAEFPSLDPSPSQPDQAQTPPQSGTPSPDALPPDTAQPDAATPAPVAEQSGQIFWLKDQDGQLQLVPETITIPGDTSPETQVKSAFDTLLSQTGDPTQDAFTTIPAQTQLLDATVEADGVHIDLSTTFTTGGGSASMVGRLGQVIYTATAFNPTAPVWISVDGQPLTLLGGEGLEVSQPITRAEFNQGFGF